MFGFFVERDDYVSQFQITRRDLVLKDHGRMWLELENFVWDYLEIAAEADSMPLPDVVARILDPHIREGKDGRVWANAIYFRYLDAWLRVTRTAYGFRNDNGETDMALRFQLPRLANYTKGVAVSSEAKALLARNLTQFIGANGVRRLMPDLHAKHFAAVKRIRTRHRKAKPQLVSD